MTIKQQFFVKHYLLTRNAKQAAIEAGYSEKTAEAAGARLLRNVKVSAAIANLLGPIFDQYDASADRIIRELALIAFARMGDYMQQVDGKFTGALDLEKIDLEHTAAIMEVTTDIINRGEDEPEIKRTKIKLQGKLEALKVLAQYRKLLTDKVEVSGAVDPDSSPVRVFFIARQPEEDEGSESQREQ
jgi:phage terminase small subunit